MNSKNIAFISIGDDSNRCAELLVKSIKKTNPDCQTIQISTNGNGNVKNVDEKYFFDFRPASFMVNRFESQIEIIKKFGPTIFCDSDMIISKNLNKIFEEIKKYDLIFTERRKDFYIKDTFKNIKFPEFTNKKANEVMPFNAGFIGINNINSAKKLLNTCLNLQKRFHFWYGDQISQKKIFDLQKFKILILDSYYNFTIGNLNEFNENVYVYHFKGRAKKLMKPFFDKYIGLY